LLCLQAKKKLFTYKYVVTPHTKGKEKIRETKKKKVFTHTLLTPTQHKTNLAPYKPKWSNHPTKTKTKKTELPPSPMVSLLSTK
jgi:hypothetical protein